MSPFKKLLLVVTFLILGLNNLDFSTALASTSCCTPTNVGFESAQTMLEPEELDCPAGPQQHRVRLIIANSVSLGDTTNLCDSSSQTNFLPLIYSGQCPAQAHLASWLDKREEHIQALKSEPLWLRYNVLLI